MIAFDHIAVLCERLEDGVAHVREALGVTCDPGGVHEAFGTHNALLSLGGEEYLEVIAVDPAGRAPGRPRWFDLDRFSGPPVLARWVCRVDDLDAAVAAHPGAGVPMALQRGAYRWAMAVPEDGILPLDNLHPALIEWQGPHPAPRLPERGLRLRRLIVAHPQVAVLDALGLDDARVTLTTGDTGLAAQIDTPDGPKWLR
ncbi:VOC family protein [Vannielia litorea]|uniref:Glyoxalase-like domain-containing protein n=1 Tax=Vannielia litorea TaxID=1217970 RepID=A0A1N6ECY1_9RHOB|nr:VOC family protein [Vannielia litorea]SIN80821.1 Glyoxalase-like domain-containing protein [Vannielia litorea]